MSLQIIPDINLSGDVIQLTLPDLGVGYEVMNDYTIHMAWTYHNRTQARFCAAGNRYAKRPDGSPMSYDRWIITLPAKTQIRICCYPHRVVITILSEPNFVFGRIHFECTPDSVTGLTVKAVGSLKRR